MLCLLSFAAETSVPSPSHGEPTASSRDAFSSWDAPHSCIWNPFSQPCRGDLGREQDSRGKGKLGVAFKCIAPVLVYGELIKDFTLL